MENPIIVVGANQAVWHDSDGDVHINSIFTEDHSSLKLLKLTFLQH